MTESLGTGADAAEPPYPAPDGPLVPLEVLAGAPGGVPPPGRHRHHLHTRTIVTGILAALTAGAVVGALVAPTSSPTTSTGAPPPRPASASPGAPADAAVLASATAPSLVDIDVTDAYQAVEGAGTGMVLAADGVVLTNNHVIEGETSISVRDVGNGRTYGATVLGYDRSEDVAVLRLTAASGLRTIATRASPVAVGDGVVAVGNAAGLGGTPSHAGGMITALDRAISARDEVSGTTEQLDGLLETNAAIVPGYSGGALVDTAARVVGMVTAASQGYQFSQNATQGYAIPIATARRVAAAIVAGRRSSTVHVGPTAFLGVHIAGTASGSPGAVIVDVIAGSPADRNGLRAGDTITAVDGVAVTSPGSLTDALLQQAPGDTVDIRLADRFGRTSTATVTLASGPPQ